jgi:sugar lactone lactonase YvrE
MPFFSITGAFAGVTATTIYNLGYPVGLAEDSSGNIYIADDHNSDASKKGIVVVPATTGTLFGQAVTAGTPKTIVAVSNPAGIAISSGGVLVWSLANGDIYGLTSTNQTLFGVSLTANTVTQIASGTGLRGGLDFDSAGNLFGVYIATGTFSVLPSASGTLFGQSVTANTSKTLYSNGSNWFWDLAVDSSGNIFLADGWGLQGVFVMPVSTGTLLGQSVTANTVERLTAFGTTRYAGIDADASDAIYANVYGGTTKVISPTSRTIFQTLVSANTLTNLSSTSGYILQGLLIASNGDIISGGNSTYRLVATPDVTVPGAPTIGSVTALSPTSASVSFTSPTSNGGATIQSYTATSTPGSITGQVFQPGSGSITVTGLTSSTTYTFRVTASNSVGTSASSSASISITTPATNEEIAAQAAAASRAAAAQREAEKRSARDEIVARFKILDKATLELFNRAEVFGITSANIDELHTEIFALPEASRADITQVLKVARKYEILGIIASERVKNIYSNSLIEIGLLHKEGKNKVTLTQVVKELSHEERSSYAGIKEAIEAEMAVIQARKDRLANILALIASRRNG